MNAIFQDFKYYPDAEYRFFIYDPEGYGFTYYKSVEDRNIHSEYIIQAYLNDGWQEEVTNVIAGEVTHHAVMCDVNIAPKREEYDNEEEYEDAISEFGDSDWDYTCNYKFAPLNDPGETAPVFNMKEVK